MLGLYYSVASGKDVNALVGLSKDANGKVALRGGIRDVHWAFIFMTKASTLTPAGASDQGLLAEACSSRGGVSRGWWNEDLSQEEGAGKKGSVVTVSPPLSKLRDDRGVITFLWHIV
jgi:hypothetical protein